MHATNFLDELNASYPIRRTEAQKSAFREYVVGRMSECGYCVRIETTADRKNQNVVIGDPAAAKIIFAAHYDTPASAIFPNLMLPRNPLLYYLCQLLPMFLLVGIALLGGFLASLPFNKNTGVFLGVYLVLYYTLFFICYRLRSNPHNANDNTSGVATVLTVLANTDPARKASVAAILFDNEEKGKKGSKAYDQDHKSEMEDKLVLNFDCVGFGENILFVAKEQAERDPLYLHLQTAFRQTDGGYTAAFYPMKGSNANSDYRNFPKGIGCMTCKRSRRGIYYTPHIHTTKDRYANPANITYIAERLSEFVNQID